MINDETETFRHSWGNHPERFNRHTMQALQAWFHLQLIESRDNGDICNLIHDGDYVLTAVFARNANFYADEIYLGNMPYKFTDLDTLRADIGKYLAGS